MANPMDLTNLNDVKEYLGLKTSTDDALLQRLITAASVFLLGQMNRSAGLDHDYQFTKGFSSIPADIAQICCELVALRYKEKDRIGEVSKNIAGQTISYTQKDVPAWARVTINQYKRVTP